MIKSGEARWVVGKETQGREGDGDGERFCQVRSCLLDFKLSRGIFLEGK